MSKVGGSRPPRTSGSGASLPDPTLVRRGTSNRSFLSVGVPFITRHIKSPGKIFVTPRWNPKKGGTEDGGEGWKVPDDPSVYGLQSFHTRKRPDLSRFPLSHPDPCPESVGLSQDPTPTVLTSSSTKRFSTLSSVGRSRTHAHTHRDTSLHGYTQTDTHTGTHTYTYIHTNTHVPKTHKPTHRNWSFDPYLTVTVGKMVGPTPDHPQTFRSNFTGYLPVPFEGGAPSPTRHGNNSLARTPVYLRLGRT